jgi:hypothetical protein
MASGSRRGRRARSVAPPGVVAAGADADAARQAAHAQAQATGALPPMARSAHADKDRADALILLGMTFACSALSLYDLFLLATNL